MSLALWSFFWDDADWGGAPAPAPAPASTDSGAGSGGKRRKLTKKPPYIRAPDDYWEARERYLKALLAEHEQEPPPAPNPLQASSDSPKINFFTLPRYQLERQQIISTLDATKSLKQLKDTGERLIQLNKAIALAKRLRIEHDLQVAREKRRRKLTRLKKLFPAISAALTLLSIFTKRRS